MTVTVTPTVEASNVPPRIRLNIVDTGGLGFINVTRLDADGRTSPVRTFDGNPVITSAGTALLYDYEAPFDSPVSYSSLESPTVFSAQVTLSQSQVWLIHPGVPAWSTPVTVAALGPRSRKVTRAVHYPLGRSTPVVQTDGARKAAEYTLSLLTMSDAERATIDTLIADAGTLLLNVPATKGWGINAEYVSVGDITETRVVRVARATERTWELPCTVVDRPAGGSQAQRTYVDVLVDNASYQTLMTKYTNYAALLAGP